METTRWLFVLVAGAACFLATAAAVIFPVVSLTRQGSGRRPVRRRDREDRERRPPTMIRPTTPGTASQRCPECGAALPEDAPEGLCPQCLLKGAISRVESSPAPSPESTTPYAEPDTAPSVEELAGLLPQLEILEVLGRGGMGTVYKARQPSLDRLVAVKVLPPQAGRDPAFAERFGREARALARLGHPNIVAVYDFGRAGELYYLVMEYVDGANLRQLLHEGQLPPAQALRIVPQICDALQFAHEEGVVHRDIKPENILLDRKGRVKIADFGLAKILGRDTGNISLTGSRQIMGTVYYMAPEQVEDPQNVDHRADIYSLGVVFYEMLTGEVPIGRFAPPSEKAGTDAYLDEVVLRAIEREPERRYQHASEVKTDVEAAGAARRPDVRVAFLPLPVRWGTTRRLFGSAAVWTFLLCLAGAASSSLCPWVDIAGYDSGWGWSQATIPGFITWEGLVATLIQSARGFLLLATGQRKPVHAWQALVSTGSGLTCALLAILFLWFSLRANEFGLDAVQYLFPETNEATRSSVLGSLRSSLQAGPYLTLLFAGGLAALGTHQLRTALLRGSASGTGAAGQTSLDPRAAGAYEPPPP
jgi:predicted Ser/Thr protein kinase